MKSQTPDLVYLLTRAEALALVEEAKANLREAQAYLDSIHAQALIKCCKCEATYPIATQEYIQTYWYTEPRGCTGGDYWNIGESNWECPGCGYKNRFDAKADKGYLDFYRPEIVALKSMFKSVRECLCEHRGLYPQLCKGCRDRKDRNSKVTG